MPNVGGQTYSYTEATRVGDPAKPKPGKKNNKNKNKNKKKNKTKQTTKYA